MKYFNFQAILLMLFMSISVQATELEASLGWAGYQQYGFAVDGVVKKVNAKPGGKFKQGDVLAAMVAEPFNYNISACKAASAELDPQIFDAKIELDQAEELFERTVLSEIELQKIDGKYKVLLEKQKKADAECALSQWQKKLSVLKVKESSYVLSTGIRKGMVISEENRSTVYIEMVSAKKASATVYLSFAQKILLNSASEVKVIVDQQEFPAKVESIEMHADENNKYKLLAVFYFSKQVEQGKRIKLRF